MPRRRLFDLTGQQAYKLAEYNAYTHKSRTGHYPWLGQPLINLRSEMSKASPSEGTRITITAPPSVGATSAPKARAQNKKLPTNIPMVSYVGDPRFNRKASYPIKSATNRKNVTKKALSAKSKPKTPVKALEQQVKKLQKAVNVDRAKHTYKYAVASSIKSLVGRCTHYATSDVCLADLESSCANLRYYDPSVPGTLVTANANTGTYARDVFFKSYYTKLIMRNNYQVPVRVKVYHCKVKNDTNEHPVTTYTSAITDQVITAGADETDQLIYLTEIERVTEVWKVDTVLDKTLEPGQEATVTNSTPSFNFDPSHIDSYTNQYQQVFKGSCYVVRLEGVLGHDTVQAENTLLAAGVDFELIRKAVIEYDAGVALNDIYISENRAQSFTTSGVCSLKPVADNISYSVS